MTETLHVARVVLELHLSHLDRLFDYSIPEELAEAAVPGVRVKVRFSGRQLHGYIVELSDRTELESRLLPLLAVVSGVPVLTSQIWRLVREVADRYAGTASDVLRLAVPPRHARVEKDFLSKRFEVHSPVGGTEVQAGIEINCADSGSAGNGVWAGYLEGPSWLNSLRQGVLQRVAWTALPNGKGDFPVPEWAAGFFQAALAVAAAGKSTLMVVPSQREIDALQRAREAAGVPRESVAVLTADQGPTARYRAFLSTLHGDVRIVIGTRSAVFAPLPELGLLCCWDDLSDLHREPHAPYFHVREVLAMRSSSESVSLLYAAHSRSTSVQRLLNIGWLTSVGPDREMSRVRTPVIVNTADSFHDEHDRFARLIRLPSAAWQAAKKGLERGPVLVQVARRGYQPVLRCAQCGARAECTQCHGALVRGSARALPTCTVCYRGYPQWRCTECGHHLLAAPVPGALRTVEEFGKAFPGVRVIAAHGEHYVESVGTDPAVVVATAGAEPYAVGGYAAALLLDGNLMLNRASLDAAEETLQRWLNAASLVADRGSDGSVVVTAEDSRTVGALVRWDPGGFAESEYADRVAVQLPPAQRMASISGPHSALADLPEHLDLPEDAVMLPEVEVDSTHSMRLIRCSYRSGPALAAGLKAFVARKSSVGSATGLRVQFDSLDRV